MYTVFDQLIRAEYLSFEDFCRSLNVWGEKAKAGVAYKVCSGESASKQALWRHGYGGRKATNVEQQTRP